MGVSRERGADYWRSRTRPMRRHPLRRAAAAIILTLLGFWVLFVVVWTAWLPGL